jgi:ABC-2 type transport system ATP-binding protein
MQHAVETIGLTKTFSDWWGRTKVYAVEDLNLKIRTNEVFGLLGPNGSGKTTTLKMLLGLLYPTRGRALVYGGDGSDPRISTRIGYLPEESYLYRYLTSRETLEFYGRLFGLPRHVRKERIEALLDMVGLKAVANRPVGTFSKGMARRIGLAQALINDPDLLILDEPTTGLDPIGTRQIKDLIVTLARRGKTILLCSHLLADVEDVCDRLAILYGGKVRAEGKVGDLLQQADKRQITTGPLSDGALSRIRQIVSSEGTSCDVSAPMERLETYFVRIVAEAQAQAEPTSGAVSTTRIGDFLSAGQDRRGVLDALVQSTAAESPQAPEPASQPIETPQPIRKDVLDRLVKPEDENAK